MAKIAYIVTATLPSLQQQELYIAWLQGGHIQAVCAGGATSAQVIRLHEPSLQVQTRYEFPSMETFDHYVKHHAPALRADGLIRFGPDSGVTFRREIGSILE